MIFIFAPCINSIKNTFIFPTDAHYYKIIEILTQFKIMTLAPTCFGSRRNHHQGAVLCLAKTTKWFFCARRYRRSQYYGGISACFAGLRFTVETVPVSTVNPSVDWYLFTDVSRQPICPILNGKAIFNLSGLGDPTVSNANAGVAHMVAGIHNHLPLECADRSSFGRE
jgi:hypothetical protein